MTIVTILVFIVILGILVFVHELGHFIMAKRAGAKVEEFGFGFPPRIFGVKRGETIYSINLIPVGGFVSIAGENGEGKDDPRSFASKTIWQRFKILAAGVSANVLLAIIVFSIVAVIGEPTFFPTSVKIDKVLDNSPAQKSGLEAKDAILSLAVDGNKAETKNITDVENFIAANRGKEISFTVKRNGEVKSLNVYARNNQEVQAGEGATGIGLVEDGKMENVYYSWKDAVYRGFENTRKFGTYIFVTLLAIFKDLFETGKTSVQLSGPYGIAEMTGQAVDQGLNYVLLFMGILSVNLAIVNALPFPALDGGRILFLLIEKIKGSKVSAETEGKFHFAGMVALLLLMVLTTIKDFGTYHVWQKITNLF